jgi:hypothetical protein
MVKLAAVCATLLSCLALAPASANAAPSQPSFTVHLLTANGSGCPPGSAAVSQASSSVFTVTYSTYIATAGRGADPTDFRKNCQLNVKVGVPSGWTFGILEVDYRGYAFLDRNARGTLSADYYFAGQSQTARQSHTIYGRRDGDYHFTDVATATAWAPCHFNASLNIDTAVRVFAGSDKSILNEITMDSTDVDMSTLYHLGFRRC